MAGTESVQHIVDAPRKGLRWTSAVLLLLLIGSVVLNVWGTVHYRLPGPLWKAIQRQRESLPQIPLASTLNVKLPQPQLGFALAAPTSDAVASWQARGREKLRELVGASASAVVPPTRSIGEANVGDITRETLVFTMPDGAEVPAFMLRLKVPQRRAALLVIPGHSRGIVATAGLIGDYQHANALALARAGYVVLTIEVRGFGYLARMGPSAESVDQQAYVGLCLVDGTTALGVTIADATAGLNYLATRTDVDRERLGVVGFSSGGKAAIMLAATDERVRAVVASGCVSSLESNFKYSLHDSYEALPGMAKWLALSDCLGLIAPRPVLVQWGEQDNRRDERCAAFNASSLAEFEAAQRIYRAAGHPERIEKAVVPGLAHEFDNQSAIGFLARHFPP